MKSYIRGMILLLALLGTTIIVGTGCAQNPVSGDSNFVLLSESDEIRLGRASHAQVLEKYGRYNDPRLQSYVQRVGADLAARSHRNNLVYHFTVLDSDEVNAFALPGGYIYITRGMLAYLNSEAALAAVLGHEIGHVTARHSVRQYSAQQAANIGFVLGSILVPELRTTGAQDLYSILGGALLRGYGRDHELEADRLGAEYLAQTGYDPQAMISVIRVLKAQEQFEKRRAKAEGREPKVYHGLFATHPDNDTRLQHVVGRASAVRTTIAPRMNRDAFLRRLDGLPFGPSTREGVLRGNDFYHRDLGISLRFPVGWRIENHAERLLAHPPANHGLLQVSVEDVNKRHSPRDFLRNRMKIERFVKGTSVYAGDLPGYTALAYADTPFGRRLSRVTVIYFGNQAYIFAGAAMDKRGPHQYDTDFLNTALSLKALSSEQQALSDALRLRIERVGDGDRYSTLVRRSRIPNYPEDQLRLLNGHYPDGEPAPGTLIKTVK